MIVRARFSDFRISIWLAIIAELGVITENRLLYYLYSSCVDHQFRLSRIERRRREKVDASKSNRQWHDRENDEELSTNEPNDRSEQVRLKTFAPNTDRHGSTRHPRLAAVTSYYKSEARASLDQGNLGCDGPGCPHH